MSILSTKFPNIIVIGDIMIDHNVYVKIEKFANEAPIPVYNFIKDEHKLGGCGNVLKNLHNLGCSNLYIFGIVGNDTEGNIIKEQVKSLKIYDYIKTIKDYKTITKHRYFCDNKLMFRCDVENKMKNCIFNIEEIQDDFISNFEKIITSVSIDCVIFSDYNKGMLTDYICENIIKISIENNIFTCVDPKNNYKKYYGCTLVKPNIHEARSIFSIDSDISMLDLHKIIHDKLKCKYSVITLSEKGISLFDGIQQYHDVSINQNIIDVTGAGDIVSCILGYYISLNISPKDAIHLATNIATKSVQYSGTYTLCKNDIIEQEFEGKKLIKFPDLLYIKELYKDKKIVFTNGCFDILHDGHIKLFKFCKEKGDIVIVGLNSDNSIRNLKGETRPINKIETRIAILDSIKYIDNIIVFEEDSPLKIIKELLPYYLIKGGDYKIKDIVGHEYAKETLICDLIDNISSTKIIEKIKYLNQ